VPCLEENEIVDLVTGNLDPQQAEAAEAHIDGCTTCRLVLIELARVFELKASSLPEGDPTEHGTTGHPSEDDVPLLMNPPAMMRGTTIGRYLVLDVLGAGAMGVVYAAFDPELDRKVALKLLRARAVGKGSSERLVREARATARLAHPNVVVVHDVGEHGGAVFMAMEFVEGGTLGEWLAAEDRDHDDILETFHDAGLGLQAAHDAGLVHRDFKPANVLMGHDGRARVTDFGLARGDGSKDTADDLAATHPGAEAKLLDATFTRTGALVGTPAYMSPEQFAGQVADARSDQFSFCVALFEALCGSRPFAGKTVTELAANVSAGRIAEPKLLDALPRRVRTALRRGLKADPADRFASMGVLLRSLQPSGLGTTSWATRAVFAGGLALAGGGLALAMTAEHAPPPDVPRCDDNVEVMRAMWSDERGSTLESKLTANVSGHEARVASRVRGMLDDFAATWVDTRAGVCDEARDPVSQAVVFRCLDRQFVHFRALVEALESGDAVALENAVHAAAQLGEPAQCTSHDWRRGSERFDPPPEKEDAVAALRERLVRIQVDEQLGHYDRAIDASDTLLADVKQVGFDPLLADLHHERGLLLAESGKYEPSLAEFEQAFAAGLRAGYDDPLVLAGSLALHVVGQSTPDPERARMWRAITEAALERLGPYSKFGGPFWNSVGLGHRLQGEFDEAREAFERSIQIYRDTDPGGTQVFFPLNNLAALEMDQRRFVAAESRARELLAAQEQAFGPEHPDLVTTLSTLASALASQHQLEEAASSIDRAIALELAWVGEDSQRLESARMTLAMVRKRQGKLEEARDLYAGVLKTWTESRGPDDPYVALAHNNLAATLGELGEMEGSLEHHQRALEIWIATRGADHTSAAQGHSAVAADLLALDRCDDARTHLQRAHAITSKLEPSDILVGVVEGNWAKLEMQCAGSPATAVRWAEPAATHTEAAVGPEHPLLGKVLATAAEAAVRNGDDERAREHVERALPLVDTETSPATRARLLYVRARAANGEAREKDVAEAKRLLPAATRWDRLRADLDAL